MNIILKNEDIILDYEGEIFEFINADGYKLHLVYDKYTEKLKGIAINPNYTTNSLLYMLNNPKEFDIPVKLNKDLSKILEVRELKVIINKAGGNASKNATSNKISLPTSWIKKMGITKESRDVIVTFDGEKIVIRKNNKGA